MILGIDGYLGWPLALWLGVRGYQISGIDNFNRRKWVKGRGSHTIVPIASMTDRLHVAKKMLDVSINFREMDLLNRNLLKEFVDEVKPDVVIHYAECPSAPYSMIDFERASFVQTNNVIGTLGVLFTIHELVPEAALIKLGTMGEYGTPASGRPLFEGVFPKNSVLHWNDQEWPLDGETIPRYPGSFYHASKVQDTVNIQAACQFWGMRSYDIMQGVIYGGHTDQMAQDHRLRTRFDIDECFGTVINRFVAQAVIGHPLTVFGEGTQIRGFIALEDAMQCMAVLIENLPDYGEYKVVNQMSQYYSIMHVAQTVARVAKEGFGLNTQIQTLENPRVECSQHPYYPVYEKLSQLGFTQMVQLDDEIKRMFEMTLDESIKKRIIEKQHLILPKTWWSGQKKEVQNLKTFNHKNASEGSI